MPSININVDFSELEDLGKKFKRADLEPVLQGVIEAFAFASERYSKIATPVDTGRLRSSITTSIGNLEARIAPHTNYAIFVHEGTRYMRGRPFMAIGLNQAVVQYFTNDVMDKIQSELNRALS